VAYFDALKALRRARLRPATPGLPLPNRPAEYEQAVICLQQRFFTPGLRLVRGEKSAAQAETSQPHAQKHD